MKKQKMIVELEYDDQLMHGDCEESKSFFNSEILTSDKGLLLLHSNTLGDGVGKITVIRLINENELKPKPCPFCGSKGIVTHKSLGFRVECESRKFKCPMNMRTHHKETSDEAIHLWNIRS